MNANFSLERLGWLMRADLVARFRTVSIISGTVAALVLLQGMLTANSPDPGKDILGPWFLGLLFVWGPIAASYSFRELHDKSGNQAYLLLPASALEKTLARLLLVTVVLGGYIVLLMYVLGWLNAVSNLLVFGERTPTFSSSEFLGPKLLAQALVMQSIYFLGAAWFRKSHFIKTSFALTLLVVGIAIFASVLFWSVFGDYVAGSFAAGDFTLEEATFFQANRSLVEFVHGAGRVVYFVILPPFCWWVAWLRLKETQVSHGV